MVWPPESLLKFATERSVTKEGVALPAVLGTCSWFGGRDDTGVTPTETGAITGEVLRQLDGDNDNFCAMRWDYAQGLFSVPGPCKAERYVRAIADPARKYLAKQLVAVYGPKGWVICRLVDWGPNERTGRVIDLSKGALKRIGATTDSVVVVHWVRNGEHLWQEGDKGNG